MKSLIAAGVMALAAGVVGLADASFNQASDPNEPGVAAIELSVKDTDTVSSPVWAGLAVMAGCGLLLLMDNR